MHGAAILTYHSLDRSGSVISTTPERFRAQMLILKQRAVRVLPLAQAVRAPGSVALTFDDGFRNFLSEALPVLSELDFAATVFVVTAHCGGWNDWGDAGRSIPRLPLMRWDELDEIRRAGIEVGAHTVHHLDLTRLPEAEAAWEMDECLRKLEQRLGTRVEALAYPYGASHPRLRALAAERFAHACGTRLARWTPGSDPRDLPRIDACYLKDWGFEPVVTGKGSGYLAARRLLRTFRAWISPSS